MKRFLRLTVLSALMLTGNAAFAQDECTKITVTGHPAYPVIAYKDGDNIVGADADRDHRQANQRASRVEIYWDLGGSPGRGARW